MVPKNNISVDSIVAPKKSISDNSNYDHIDDSAEGSFSNVVEPEIPSSIDVMPVKRRGIFNIIDMHGSPKKFNKDKDISQSSKLKNNKKFVKKDNNYTEKNLPSLVHENTSIDKNAIIIEEGRGAGSKRGGRRTALIGFSIFIVLLGLIGGTAYAHQSIYQNKIFPGSVVWGEKVGGKSVIDAQKIVAKKAASYSITIKGPDQDYKATAHDLGVTFSSDSMALSAYAKGRSGVWLDDYLVRGRLLLAEIPWKPFQDFVLSKDLSIAPSYTVNQETLNAYLTKISDNIRIQAQDSQVTVAGSTTQLKPAIYGRQVDYANLKTSVLSNISSLKSDKINVITKSIKPDVVDDSAQDVILQAQSVMARPVVLTYKNVEYRPNQDTVGSWITFTKNSGDTKYTLAIDQTKMASYFSFLESKINVYSTERVVRVENGVKQTEAQAGVDGILLDRTALGSQIASILPNQANVKLEIPTYVDKFKTRYENVVIANWDKYVDINLSTQSMIACEKGGTNCREWKVTTGDLSHPTPTGTFLVLGRSASFYMTGGTYGKSDYYHLWVDHATWFTSAGHAIHDAYWRNGSFGGDDYKYTGSHGCINAPNDASTFIYNWATIGTPVVIHY